MMEKIISCCGLDCASCDARIATMADDNALRAQTAEQWMKQFGATGLTADMINCTGCMEPGVKIGHAPECKIRNCAIAKGYRTCAECDIMTSCELLAPVHKFSPAALENLKSLN